MCDCPVTTIYTTHEKVQCSWIVYGSSHSTNNHNNRERDGATSGAGGGGGGLYSTADETETDGGCCSTNESDPALDNVYMMLEPHLRPVTPDLDVPQSKQIFDEHKQLAQEYFKVQTELAYLSKHRKELLEKRGGTEQLKQRNQLNKLQDERDQLRKLHQNLLRQLEILQTSDINDESATPMVPMRQAPPPPLARNISLIEDGWEFVTSPSDNN